MNQQTETILHNRHIRMILWCLTTLAAIVFTAGVMASEGGVSIGQTRVLFEGSRKSEKVTVTNHSGRVYLINSRVLSMPDRMDSETDSLPFMVTPPLFRLESGSRNTLLVVRNDTSALPSDRESVFYLSVLAIPAVSKPSDNDGADYMMQPRMSVGIRSVIKLFYRPSELPITAAEAQEKLHFTVKDGMLHVENTTPYYLTLAELLTDGTPVDVREQNPMIPPYTGRDYRMKGRVSEVSWSVIDDYGGISRIYRSEVQ